MRLIDRHASAAYCFIHEKESYTKIPGECMAQTERRAVDSSDTLREGAVLSKAVARAAEFLELPNKVVARTLGISESSVSRLKTGAFVVTPDTKPFELAQMFVRLFRSLDAVTGSDDNSSRSWFRSENTALRGKPIELIQTVQGLIGVLAYVDSRRAPI
jgi:hypothetical protein